MNQPTQDPKCPACKNGVEAKNTVVGEFNNLCDKHQSDINGHLISLTTPATKPLDEQMKEIISFAILDGQNQIHDLKDGTATSEQITDRMFKSLDYFTDQAKALITNAEKQARINELNTLLTTSYKEYYIDHLKHRIKELENL